jgi:hypothetical protein
MEKVRVLQKWAGNYVLTLRDSQENWSFKCKITWASQDISSHFMEPEIHLPFSQRDVTCSYLKPVYSSPRRPILLILDQF